MRIGIIADTHLSSNLLKLKALFEGELKEVEGLIHVGDFKEKPVLEQLEKLKPLIGVWGNNDDYEIKKLLNEEEIIEIEGYKIGIYHGHGENKTTIDRAYERFKEKKVDLIVFGHSHQPNIITKNKVLMLNPGSPTNKRREKWFSYIILTLEKNSIKAELRLFDGEG